ncbi:cytochrome P450 [Amycolatopsis sp. NPDC049868]|uniref:cytochrome P450 n=1 Tax=Amycolatopsis sp. NPDC049868 TaxID=3363934 RepID=UPI0037AFC2F2
MTAIPAAPPRLVGALPLVGHALEFLRDPTALLTRGQLAHGNVYSLRLGRRDAVVLLGPEHSRFVFTETDRRLSFKDAYPFVMRMFDPEFYFFADDEEYQRQRSIVLPRFQGRQLDDYVRLMSDEVQEFMHGMGESGEFDLPKVFGPMVMRIAATTLFGERFAAQLGEGEFALFRQFSAGINGVLPQWLPAPSLLRGIAARKRLHTMLAGFLAQRRNEPVRPPDFFQTLAEARYSDGSPVPDKILINMLIFLTWSGHETTTGHLCWGLVDLLQHPAESNRIVAEQREVLGSAVPRTLKQVDLMKHLDNALHETERLRPVVFTMLRRASEDIEYGGHLIPRGSLVLVSPWVTHRLPDVFTEPDRYRPDRFRENPKAKTNLIGFGGGIHRCLGQHFAYLEMKVVLSMLLCAYEFELLDQVPRPVKGAKTKWPASPCRVRYTRRDGTRPDARFRER